MQNIYGGNPGTSATSVPQISVGKRLILTLFSFILRNKHTTKNRDKGGWKNDEICSIDFGKDCIGGKN